MRHQFAQFTSGQSRFKSGLPACAYTSEEFWHLEQQSLFNNHWVFVAYAHQLSNVGDAIPVSVGGRPLLLVRGDDNQIRAFHNVCRHRCLKLIDNARNCGRSIRCPYHSWVYSLRGELKRTPFFGGRNLETPEGFSLQDNGLISIACNVWHDWVFVNLDGEARSFSDFIEPLERQLGELPVRRIKPVAMIDLGIVQCNWKFLMENFIEPYHVQFVHRTTTKQPLVDHYTIQDQHCLGSGCNIDACDSGDIVDKLAVTSHYLTLFPNFVMGTYAPDQVGVHLNIPLNVHQTQQYRAIYVHEDRHVSTREIENLRSLWYDVHKEDHAMCERLQAGRASPVAETGGWLSPHWENSVREFQQLVVEATLGTQGHI